MTDIAQVADIRRRTAHVKGDDLPLFRQLKLATAADAAQ